MKRIHGRNMVEIPFTKLVAAIKRPKAVLSTGNRLEIPAVPDPFVEPPLRLINSDPGASLSAEVLLIQASAAVGKSTTARYLSSSLGVPLLDLAKIPVSTGSLKALLMDVSGMGDPLSAFHEARLPIIVDALDEGRLHSGEASFDSFLTTTGEFLMENRAITNLPKLILFGRYEATDLAEIGLCQASDSVTIQKMEVSFFGEEAAWKLIHAYANLTATSTAAYRQHPAPAEMVIRAYFDAIETALGLNPGALWGSDHGKAFAGYAPVLAAVGSLLAEMDNFPDVANRLKASATQEAWGVIEAVLQEIIEREQRKLSEQLAPQITASLPPEAYDAEEQLTLLSRYVHRQSLQASRRVGLTGVDQARYQSMVQVHIHDHPFVRQREFGNAVLGSVVMAHAIIRDLLGSADFERMADLSRQPFLWRAFLHRLSDDSLIDGSYVGYVLNSLWNEYPEESESRVLIRTPTDELAKVDVNSIDSRSRSAAFDVTMPLMLYAQIRRCDLDTSGSIKLIGHGPHGGAVFFMRDAQLISHSIDLVMDSIRFDGDVWLEADELASPPQLKVHLNGAKVGWAGQFSESYPWSGFRPKLAPPYEVVQEGVLNSLVLECARRIPPNVTPILNPDFTPAEDDPHMRWVRRQFAKQFPALVNLAIKHDLGSFEAIQASGMGKVRVRFTVSWEAVLDELVHPGTNSSLEPFITEARATIR